MPFPSTPPKHWLPHTAPAAPELRGHGGQHGKILCLQPLPPAAAGEILRATGHPNEGFAAFIPSKKALEAEV
eukprot:s4797_g1.t1